MTVLKVDYDSAKLPPVEMRVGMMAVLLHLRVKGLYYARTRRGWHVVVTVAQRMAPAQIVACQAILGSDPMRELFNLARVRRLRSLYPHLRDGAVWNVLYSEHHRRIAF